jgi:hypothetical protein
MQAAAPSMESTRHAQLREFLAGGADVEIGTLIHFPLTLQQLKQCDASAPYVMETHSGGLTAMVYRLHLDGRDYALKLRRPHALVKNFDGETSFLNELLRRAEIEQLRSAGRWPPGASVTPTIYASHRHGVLVTPWVNGGIVSEWTAHTLKQTLAAGAALIESGFFEWDFSPGNILDDGQQVWLFDLGYCYRFDPLTQFNTAGTGHDEPLFHLVERIETRNLFATWLMLETREGLAAALAHYRSAKVLAIECYAGLAQRLAARGAHQRILAWLHALVDAWSAAVQSEAALQRLYQKEGWRSHMLDLMDDLSGQSCTPTTLKRADWLLAALETGFTQMQRDDAFLWDDRGQTQTALIARYRTRREQAQANLIKAARAA